MSNKIEAEFIMDFAEDEPRRLVRLTLDAESVESIRQMISAGGDYHMSLTQPEQAMTAYSAATFCDRVLAELGSRSLFSQEEFKATKPAEDGL